MRWVGACFVLFFFPSSILRNCELGIGLISESDSYGRTYLQRSYVSLDFISASLAASKSNQVCGSSRIPESEKRAQTDVFSSDLPRYDTAENAREFMRVGGSTAPEPTLRHPQPLLLDLVSFRECRPLADIPPNFFNCRMQILAA